MKQILIGLAAVAMVALIQGLFYTIRFFSVKKREELRRRIQTMDGGESGQTNLLRQGQVAHTAWLSAMMRGVPLVEPLENLLRQAQVAITVAQLAFYSAMAALASALVGTAIGGWPLAIFGILAGAGVPSMLIMAKRDRRSRKLSEQLPDALDMMARSLRAGHALPAAFRLVASEMPEPVCTEFGHAFEEQNLGSSFERAVLQMTKRMPNNADLKIFAVSVVIQKETGGNLVEVIEKMAETIRGRYRFFGKLRSLTAEGRASGLVLGALPLVAGLATSLGNPSYMRLLVTTRVGQGFLFYAVVSWILGVLWLRRMTKVDF
jgi:tight adherence protein B